MTSYLRSWLTTGTSAVNPSPSSQPDPPAVITISEPDSEDDEGSATETEQDDSPPAFPSLNSAQRLQINNAPRILADSMLMPPPPLPGLAARTPGISVSSVSSLMVPPEVALAPGHSPLDWANLKSSGADLRGVDTLLRIPPSVLKQHNKRDDAWSAFYGKVYNITPYLSFHPGGEKDLMRVAGKDGTNLFAKTHGWVNVDFMLDVCLVGFLVAEPSM
ncbi:cytochrome b5 [Cyathus striatus]|nr:cytochrome b5 [Cyathus striatus]